MASSKSARTPERWEAEFKAGKWDFLKDPSEQERLRVVCDMALTALSDDASFVLIDLGSGEGLLAEHMIEALDRSAPSNGVTLAHYVPVDIAKAALDRIAQNRVPVSPVHASLRQLDVTSLEAALGKKGSVRAVIVANEVLTYDEDSVEQLLRVTDAIEKMTDTKPLVIVSCVGPHPDKPNWTASSQALWEAVSQTRLSRIEARIVRDETSGVMWDIVAFE